MNSANQNIPSFIPFDKIMVCGNIISAKYLFRIGNYYPIIIGKSPENKPEVYFYVKTQNEIKCIVQNNQTNHSQVECNNNDTSLRFKVKTIDGKKSVTFFELLISENCIPEITILDLRPLGLNIWGQNNSLFIGTTCYKDNIIECSEVFFFTE